jgi:quinol monooxygenase YgiN
VVQLFLKIRSLEGKEREMAQVLRTIMLPARLERGCIRVELQAEVEHPNVLCYMEEWATETDVVTQLCADRINHLLELMESASEKPLLEFRFVSGTRGLDYIADARAIRGRSTKSDKSQD